MTISKNDADVFSNQGNRLTGVLYFLKDVFEENIALDSISANDEDRNQFYKMYVAKIVIPWLYSGSKFFVDNHAKVFKDVDMFHFASFHGSLYNEIKTPFLKKHVDRLEDMKKFTEHAPDLNTAEMKEFFFGVKAFVYLILYSYVRVIQVNGQKGKGVLRLLKKA